MKDGAAALGAVAQQGELGDHQHAAAGFRQGPVHLALVILEDAQVNDLVGQPVGINFGVAIGHAQQDHQPGADFAHHFAGHGDTGPADPLYDGFHEVFSPWVSRPLSVLRNGW